MVMILRRIVLAALLFFMIVSCSGSDEKDKESVINKTTEKIASEAISSIRTPIEKANLVKKLSEDHARVVEEAAGQPD